MQIQLLFAPDILEEIKESESRRPTVESDIIKIDEANNALWFGDTAAIVNASAFSIKTLYAKHGTNLLSRNLRYHIAGRDIDSAIKLTIENDPDSFWRKNNGITIICDEFQIDGKLVKLKNFSVVNGGQTTYMLHKSNCITEQDDLFLPCKIIEVIGTTEDEKNIFSLEIAKATNSQKAIKQVDLKANSPEQVRFSQAMREVGVFYQTKRGETIPKEFNEDYLNTDLLEIGKLCLAGIFQQPCSSRAKPSLLYDAAYYGPVFDHNQGKVAAICKEFLYIDYYFRKSFQKKFDKENEHAPDSNDRIAFAHNARTICIAFVAFAARYYQGNIDDDDMQIIFNSAKSESASDSTLYDIFRDIDSISFLLPPALFKQKEKYESILDDLFNTIIEKGLSYYMMAKYSDPSLNATNFLKRDKNYYRTLQTQWPAIRSSIKTILDEARH